MITVNSLSSGMSSSFMGIHFPADHNVFACVEQEAYKRKQQHRFGRAGMQKEILDAYNWLRLFQPGFWASAEDDRSLVIMHKLTKELTTYHSAQFGGVEVVFAHYYGDDKHRNYDDIVKYYLPNARKRICTQHLKVYPIYRYCIQRIMSGGRMVKYRKKGEGEPLEMRIGFRLDELDRTINLWFRDVLIKDRVPDASFDMQEVINKYKIPDYLVRWWDVMDVEASVKSGQRKLKENPFNLYEGDYYRVPSFPLIEYGITKKEVVKYWSGRPDWIFPPISNCIMCFHHSIKQLQKQWQDPYNIAQMEWAVDAENAKGRTFLKNFTMEQVKNLPIQTELEFSDFTGCDAGSCTD